MIEIENLTMQYPIPKRYKEYLLSPFTPVKKFTALKDINLTIEEGDRVAFLGENGSGKTTLLKLIGGLMFPSTGSIKVNGYDTVKDSLKSRKTIGFILNEERSFYWRLTGYQNLEFFGVLDNITQPLLGAKINKLLHLVGLEDSGNRIVAYYSSGMKQRLAIARGLLGDPNILILDEPTRTLDPAATENVREIISDKIHADERRTLLIATHSFDEAEALCNKVCIIKKGTLVSYTPISDILTTHSSLAEFYRAKVKPHAYV